MKTTGIVTLEQFQSLLSLHHVNYLDFETNSLDMRAPDFRVVGCCLANHNCPDGVYLPLENKEHYHVLVDLFYKVSLVGHNIGFDAKVLHRMALDVGITPTVWPWIGDTMVLYKLIDNRGYKGQRWSLKVAMKEVLGWKDTNEKGIGDWLIANGYFRNQKGKQIPQKSEMWRCPVEIMAVYGCLDAKATKDLDAVLTKRASAFPDLVDLYQREFMTLAMLINEQFWRGMHVEKDSLTTYRDHLEEKIQRLEQEFLYNTAAAPFVEEFNQEQRRAIRDAEPKKYKADGTYTVRWLKWEEKEEASRTENYFSVTSKPQIKWLLYQRLYNLVDIQPKTNWKGEQITVFNSQTKKHWNLYEATVVDNTGAFVGEVEGKAYSDQPIDYLRFSADKGILPHLGDAGQVLYDYNEAVKELGYVVAMIESLRLDNKLWVHPTSLNVHGTITGRCSGGGYEGHTVNIQQIPKTEGYMKCLTARPGHKLLQQDYSSLENVITAELSGDAGLFALYGSGVPNDGHLFFGSYMKPLRDELTRYGYDPLKPTPEAIKKTKKLAKSFRNIAKTVVYLCTYGGGATTLRKNLLKQSFEMTIDDCKDLIKGYWDAIPDVQPYYRRLKAEWKYNGGWLFNGLFRPMQVPDDYQKDLPSRVIQSTGHDLTLRLLYYTDKLRRERDVTMYPVVCDFHDEQIWEAPDSDVEAAKKVMEDALVLVNNSIQPTIPLEGGVEVCDNFSTFKLG